VKAPFPDWTSKLPQPSSNSQTLFLRLLAFLTHTILIQNFVETKVHLMCTCPNARGLETKDKDKEKDRVCDPSERMQTVAHHHLVRN